LGAANPLAVVALPRRVVLVLIIANLLPLERLMAAFPQAVTGVAIDRLTLLVRSAAGLDPAERLPFLTARSLARAVPRTASAYLLAFSMRVAASTIPRPRLDSGSGRFGPTAVPCSSFSVLDSMEVSLGSTTALRPAPRLETWAPGMILGAAPEAAVRMLVAMVVLVAL